MAVAKVSDAEAEIAFLKLTIKKLQREIHGQRSERKQRLLDQLELQLDELEASATEDELAAEKAAAETAEVQGFTRRRPSRKPFPAHLPRERVVVPGPTACACCGSEKLSKIGEDVTETLEAVPRQWKVIQTVREKFTCRACEKISQPPAPFHPTPRGWAGPNLLAMILFEKYGQHQPLNRQRDRYAREGVDLSLSTLADQVGACTVALKPLHDLIADHVLAAERLHGDDTPVPVLARGRCATGRAWVYVRDDRPFRDSKTGARRVPLTPAVEWVLDRIPRIEGNPWVITGKNPGDHLKNLDLIWQRIRERAGLEDVRVHDCRHSYASRALALGEGIPVISKLLGHRRFATTARYAHLAREGERRSAAMVGDSIGGDILAGGGGAA